MNVVAGKIATKGIELAGAVNPFGGLKLWGNVAFVQSRFVNFDFVDGNGVPQSYSGKTPPNVPRVSSATPAAPIASRRHGRSNSARRSATSATASISRTTSWS